MSAPSTPTPPPTTPGKKWGARFGAAVRRSSTILSVASSRPSTPGRDSGESSRELGGSLDGGAGGSVTKKDSGEGKGKDGKDSDTASVKSKRSMGSLRGLIKRTSTTNVNVPTSPPPASSTTAEGEESTSSPPLAMLKPPILAHLASGLHSQPSPIAESPMREERAMADEAQGGDAQQAEALSGGDAGKTKSPLSYGGFSDPFDDLTLPESKPIQAPTILSSEPSFAPTTTEEPAPLSLPVEHQKSTSTSSSSFGMQIDREEYVPPPVVDTETAGNPGAFTDDPDQLPDTGPVKDPFVEDSRKSVRSLRLGGGVEVKDDKEEEEGKKEEGGKREEGGGPIPVSHATSVAPSMEPVPAPAPPPVVATAKPPTPSRIPTRPSSRAASIKAPSIKAPSILGVISRAPSTTAHLPNPYDSSAGQSMGTSKAPSVVNLPVDAPSLSSGMRGLNSSTRSGVGAGVAGGVVAGAVIASAAAASQQEKKREKEREGEDLGGSWIDTIQSSHTPPKEREYTLPAYDPGHGMDMSTQVWGSPEPMRMPEPQSQPTEREREMAREEERKIQVEPFDPFADRPVFPNPHHEEPIVPIPVVPIATAAAVAAGAAVLAASDAPRHVEPISMPLPPSEEVIHPSTYLDREMARDYETDERAPLIPAGSGSGFGYGVGNGNGHGNGYGATNGGYGNGNGYGTTNDYPYSNPYSGSTTRLGGPLRLTEMGWSEYHLPDGTTYYVHSTLRVTTDVNLREEAVLEGVSAYLGMDNGVGGKPLVVVPAGCEIWLREQLVDTSNSKKGRGGKGKKNKPSRKLETYLVDHSLRSVLLSSSSSLKGKYPDRDSTVGGGEDHLDSEFRYWTFIEGHPAHNPPSVKAKNEAIQVLNWAWTDRILPASVGGGSGEGGKGPVPAPFDQGECQELMGLLKGFPDTPDPNNPNAEVDTAIQSRITARILIRLAQWRQAHFRPDKPLPTDVSSPPLPSSLLVSGKKGKGDGRPLARTLLDLSLSIVLLGVPYLFFDKAYRASGRGGFGTASDRLLVVESGGGGFGRARGMGDVYEYGGRPTMSSVVMGACTCIVASIILSISITLLSLPAFSETSDPIARVAALVSTFGAALSLASMVGAVFVWSRSRSRSTSTGDEGKWVITPRSVMLSLPLVFLAYSLIALFVALVVYTIHSGGITATVPWPWSLVLA